MTAANEPSGVARRAQGYARNIAFRLQRKLAARYDDVEVRQLRTLRRAYNGGNPPEVLMFGDSAMIWTSPKDRDPRHLVEMIRDEVRPELSVLPIVGPGYNPRIILAFLTALERCRHQPKVVIVPTSVLMATSTWLAHPVLGYEKVAGELSAAIADKRLGFRRRLARPSVEDEDKFDRLPAPSLIGARRTNGELRLLTNSRPTTRWQQVIRLRAMVDHYNAEALSEDSVGVQLVGQLGRRLADLQLRSVAYIAPINYEVVQSALGKESRQHLERNAKVVENAFLGGANRTGEVINAVFDSPASDFIDPLHLNESGRRRLAARISKAAVKACSVGSRS